MVKVKEEGEWLPRLEGDDGKQGIAGEGQIQSGLWPSMPVAIFLPSGRVAFVVVAVFNAPVPAHGSGGTGFLLNPEAGEEEARMALEGLRFFLLAPVALDSYGGAGAKEPCGDRRDGFYGGFAGVNAPVVSFAA